MFSLKIQNAKNEIFELTHDSQNYYVIDVQGLAPPKTAINTSVSGTIDGSFFNSARVEQRNIVITLVFNGDIEANRQRLYNIFSTKQPCKIYFKNKNRDVTIDGYVEAFECNLFAQREQAQISLICPRPYFEDLEIIYTELAQIVRMFEFPFSISAADPVPMSEIQSYPLCTINNNGDVECGVIMSIDFTDSANGFKIYNVTTQKKIGFDFVFADGDNLVINTKSGNMGATLTRAGQTINLLNYFADGSEWIKLALGDNDFTFTATSGASGIRIVFANAALYGGV
jgi:phage-related protein